MRQAEPCKDAACAVDSLHLPLCVCVCCVLCAVCVQCVPVCFVFFLLQDTCKQPSLRYIASLAFRIVLLLDVAVFGRPTGQRRPQRAPHLAVRQSLLRDEGSHRQPKGAQSTCQEHGHRHRCRCHLCESAEATMPLHLRRRERAPQHKSGLLARWRCWPYKGLQQNTRCDAPSMARLVT
jgi:hypothetical protein